MRCAMKDDVLNGFVEGMLQEEIDNVEFERYIDMFSRFLGYTNPDYKYNGTYLEQYISDFMQVYQMLRNKNEKYHEIFMALIGLGHSFEFLADQSFFASFLLKPEIKREYISINKAKIISTKLEIKVKIESENKEYIFCKEYDFEKSKLSEMIRNDVKKYIKMKKIRRTDNEAS